MSVLRIDAILKAVAVERGDKLRVYTPSPASLRRLVRSTCQACWVYQPCAQPQLYVWELARFNRACVSWRDHATAVTR